MVQFIIGPPIIKGFATITFFFITYMTRSETWSNKPSLHKVLVIDHSKKCNNFAQFSFSHHTKIEMVSAFKYKYMVDKFICLFNFYWVDQV